MEAVAEPSLAERRALNKFGIAIAAMIKIMATTINSSISENPLLFFLFFFICFSFCFSWFEMTALKALARIQNLLNGRTGGIGCSGQTKTDYGGLIAVIISQARGRGADGQNGSGIHREFQRG